MGRVMGVRLNGYTHHCQSGLCLRSQVCVMNIDCRIQVVSVSVCAGPVSHQRIQGTRVKGREGGEDRGVMG